MVRHDQSSDFAPGHDPLPLVGLSLKETFATLGTSPPGLSPPEAEARLLRFGRNEIQEVARTPLAYRFLSQFTHLMALILWVGSGVAFAAAMPELGFAILGVILINAVFSFWQEYEAERAVEALRRLLPPREVTFYMIERGALPNYED